MADADAGASAGVDVIVIDDGDTEDKCVGVTQEGSEGSDSDLDRRCGGGVRSGRASKVDPEQKCDGSDVRGTHHQQMQ